MTATTRPRERVAERSGGGGLLGSCVVYGCELSKLARQLRTRLVAVLCLLGPFAFVAALGMQNATPDDTLFGRWVHTSGFAVPLVILGFGSQWAFPALTSVVAGDMFASEDHFGTWTTVLTRSRSRAEIFAGKTLAAMTYALLMMVLLAVSSMAAGVLLVGHQPLINLSGVLVGSGDWPWLVLECWATVLPPVLAFTAFSLLMSVATRNGPAGIAVPVVVGLLTQLGSMVGMPPMIQALLPATSFKAWHGLLATEPFVGPSARGLLVSVVSIVICLVIAYVLLARRDMEGS